MHHCFFCQGLRSFFLTPAAPFRRRWIPPPPVPPAGRPRAASSSAPGPPAARCRPGRSGTPPVCRPGSAGRQAGGAPAQRLPAPPLRTVFGCSAPAADSPCAHRLSMDRSRPLRNGAEAGSEEPSGRSLPPASGDQAGTSAPFRSASPRMLRVWAWLRPSTSGVWKKEYPMRPVWSSTST